MKKSAATYRYLIVAGLCALVSLRCGVTQPVRVMDKKEVRTSLSIGGPVTKLAGLPLPVPYLNAGVMYGCGENLTLTSNLHAAALSYGTFGIDAGVVTRILKEDGAVPEITGKGQLYFFSDIVRGNSPRLFPMASLNASFSAGRSTLLYAGADNLFQIHPSAYFISPFLGIEFPLSSVLKAQAEAKWIAANVNTSHGIFEGYGSIGGRGNAGIYFGLQYEISSPRSQRGEQ